VLDVVITANRKPNPAFQASALENLTTIWTGHALPKAMHADPAPNLGLIWTFCCHALTSKIIIKTPNSGLSAGGFQISPGSITGYWRVAIITEGVDSVKQLWLVGVKNPDNLKKRCRFQAQDKTHISSACRISLTGFGIGKDGVSGIDTPVFTWQQSGNISHYQVRVVLTGLTPFGSYAYHWREQDGLSNVHLQQWTSASGSLLPKIIRCTNDTNRDNRRTTLFSNIGNPRFGQPQTRQVRTSAFRGNQEWW
jgi:hypothetical protein